MELVMINKDIISSILIVDDDPQVSQLIQCILSEENYQIEIADSGREALNHRNLKSFDLILLDINMPKMSGYELCNALKDSYETKEIPVIFLTGNCLPDDKVQGFNCGAIDYITKPFNGTELIARVKNHLELKHTHDLLKEMALMDGLTKLYNHSYIHERLSEEISNTKRHNLELSLIMIDLDNFKLINDTYGHKLGDNVLRKVSSTILELIREEDVAGRYGGEEFIIILPNTDYSAAYKVAEKIRNAVKSLVWSNEDLQITLSGGVYTLGEETVNGFIEKADMLLYKAKNSGKDRIMTGLHMMN
jgi:diguanylate cyclase (GGDEF)-like protein